MEEIWKPVVGYEGQYEVSNKGNVRSLDRTQKDVQGLKRFKGQTLCPWTHKSGHLYVSLHRNKKKKNFQVHQLVATAFIGPCPEKQEVCHNDGIHTNNVVTNLRYGTRKENIEDKRKHQGRLCYGSISDETLVEIFRLSSEGLRNCEIARKLNIRDANVSRILSGNRYYDASVSLGLIKSK